MKVDSFTIIILASFGQVKGANSEIVLGRGLARSLAAPIGRSWFEVPGAAYFLGSRPIFLLPPQLCRPKANPSGQSDPPLDHACN